MVFHTRTRFTALSGKLCSVFLLARNTCSRKHHNIVVTCHDTSGYSSNFKNDAPNLFFRTSEACKKGFIVYPKVRHLVYNIAFIQDYRQCINIQALINSAGTAVWLGARYRVWCSCSVVSLLPRPTCSHTKEGLVNNVGFLGCAGVSMFRKRVIQLVKLSCDMKAIWLFLCMHSEFFTQMYCFNSGNDWLYNFYRKCLPQNLRHVRILFA